MKSAPALFSIFLLVLCISSALGGTERGWRRLQKKNLTDRSRESKRSDPVAVGESSPRLCPNAVNTTGLTGTFDGTGGILSTLFGGDLSGIGFALSIPVAIASAIFWGIIFLIIFYFVFYKKGGGEEEGGYGGGYGNNQKQSYYGQSYGRSLMDSGLNTMTDLAWKAIDKFAEYNEVVA